MADEKTNDKGDEATGTMSPVAVKDEAPSRVPEMSHDDFGRWMERVFDWPRAFDWPRSEWMEKMMDRKFDWPDRLLRDMPGRLWADRLAPALEAIEHQLRVEEEFRDGELVIKVEMPGLDPEKDVEIQLSDGHLHISAERRTESKEDNKGRVRSEFRYGSFRRSLPMPANTNAEDIKATYKDGVLELHVPVRAEQLDKTRIPVVRS